MHNNLIKGFGLGLRLDHIDNILNSKPKIPWFEVITEDFLFEGPQQKKILELRNHYPLILHSVGLNICGLKDYDKDHLKKYKILYDKIEPVYISDHICWSEHGARFHHDLLPVLKNKQSLDKTISRVSYLQDYFGRKLMLENITSYIEFKDEDLEEANFIKELAIATDCHLLFDLSNAIINSKNHNTSLYNYIESFPMDRVKQIHLSGSSVMEGVEVDSHSSLVKDYDLEELKKIYSQRGNIPTMIERDSNIPSFAILLEELIKIEEVVCG